MIAGRPASVAGAGLFPMFLFIFVSGSSSHEASEGLAPF
jgi:hypothetical protein